MKKIMFFCLMALMVTSAQAAVTSTTNVLGPGAVPDNLDRDEVENALPQVFEEQQGVELADPLDVDIANPGSYFFGGTCSDTGTIPAGVTVNSYLVHYDPLGTGVIAEVTGCSVTLDGLILGLIYQSGGGGGPDNLGASDTVVGDSTTYWIHTSRGMDLCWYPIGDPISLSGDRLTVDFGVYASAVDEMRIIELAENSISKRLTEDGGDVPGEIGIYKDETTEYTFVIDYAGPAALVMDTVPAEFAVVETDPEVDVDVFSANKGNKANKSATIITWNAPAGLSSLEVTIETRESPGQGHGKKGMTVYKPTSCGPLALNDGATAYEVDEFGALVFDAFGEMIPIVGPSDPLEVEAVCGEKPCVPDGVTATLQLGDGDDDILVEWNTVCDVDIVYTVYRSFNSGPFTEIESLLNASSHLDEDLAPGNYCYVIGAEYVAQVPHYESGLSDVACDDVPVP